MPTGRKGSGGRRHGRGRGGLPVAVEPREVDEAMKTCATVDRMVFFPGPSPRAAPFGRADHDPYRNQPTGGSVGGHFCPLASRSGAEPSGRADHDDHDPYRNQPSRGSAGGRTGPPPSRPTAEPVPCQEHVALPPSPKPAVSYLDKLMSNITLKAATSSQIFLREPEDWYHIFYIRSDRQGHFHTYPDIGGPFKSLHEADNAINRHLHALEDPKMSKDSLDKLSIRELAVRKALYFPDGTRREGLELLDETLDDIYLLVHALVDQYNDDHKLLEDRALQLKDVQRQLFFFSKGNLYYHLNFTARNRGVVDSFFAEVKCTRGEDEEMVARCFCIVKPGDNGLCHGCKNNGAVDMKHPSKADAYCCGDKDEYMSSLGGYHMEQTFESVEDEEERLRYQFKCFDDPRFMAEHFPNCVR